MQCFIDLKLFILIKGFRFRFWFLELINLGFIKDSGFGIFLRELVPEPMPLVPVPVPVDYFAKINYLSSNTDTFEK